MTAEVFHHCGFRWKNTLDYTIHFGEWRYEEDRTLWLTVQELGAGKVLVKILVEALCYNTIQLSFDIDLLTLKFRSALTRLGGADAVVLQSNCV